MLASGASAQSQQFCVKWNSYSTNLQSVFPRLLTSEHFVDLTLACEGRMIKCHKVVLSACSTYFERLLVQNPCQHPIIFMKDMKHWEVQALVDFMYKGEVNVSQDELNSLLVAAEALQIRGLCGSQQQQHHQSQQQSNLAQSSASTVQLPHDTVLSGGGGRESPPSYKRRRNQDDEAHTTPKISMSPSLNSRHSLPSDINSHHINQQHASSSERYSDHQEQHSDKKIKQEVEVEDNYLEGEVDVEEDFTNLEHPEDSDSNNREDAPLDQPGPSGLTSSNPPSMDKAVTGWEEVSTGVRHELLYMPGQKNKVRRRCVGCFQKVKNERGKREAYNRCRRVVSYCAGCRRSPAMCPDCFFEKHRELPQLRKLDCGQWLPKKERSSSQWYN